MQALPLSLQPYGCHHSGKMQVAKQTFQCSESLTVLSGSSHPFQGMDHMKSFLRACTRQGRVLHGGFFFYKGNVYSCKISFPAIYISSHDSPKF